MRYFCITSKTRNGKLMNGNGEGGISKRRESLKRGISKTGDSLKRGIPKTGNL